MANWSRPSVQSWAGGKHPFPAIKKKPFQEKNGSFSTSMHVLGTTLCGKRRMGLQHVGPAIHNTFACLLGVDVPQEELPQKDSVVQFNFLLTPYLWPVSVPHVSTLWQNHKQMHRGICYPPPVNKITNNSSPASTTNSHQSSII